LVRTVHRVSHDEIVYYVHLHFGRDGRVKRCAGVFWALIAGAVRYMSNELIEIQVINSSQLNKRRQARERSDHALGQSVHDTSPDSKQLTVNATLWKQRWWTGYYSDAVARRLFRFQQNLLKDVLQCCGVFVPHPVRPVLIKAAATTSPCTIIFWVRNITTVVMGSVSKANRCVLTIHVILFIAVIHLDQWRKGDYFQSCIPAYYKMERSHDTQLNLTTYPEHVQCCS